MATTFHDIEKFDNGAHFYNADLHVHSYGGSHDVKDVAMTPEAIVDEAVKMGLGLVAITDHNSDANTQKAIDHAQKYAGVLLVLAGVEISTAHGHLLVYAAPDKAASIRNLLAKINLVGDSGDQDAHTAMSMADVIKEAAHLGCVSVAAHVDRQKSGFEMLAQGYPNWKKDILSSPGLYGFECDDSAHLCWYSEADEATNDGANRKSLFAGRLTAPATMGRPELAHIQGSDAHSLQKFVTGRAGKLLTRFKLNELSFDAFRIALTDPDARVRALATIPRSLPRILGMQVSGGFLGGQTFYFSDNLNCFIGGRGTGKSSALKTLAFGLGLDDELEEQDNCPGTVIVYCEDENDVRYRYERIQGGRPIVKAKDEGEILDVPDTVFRVEYYRQGELAEVSKNPLKTPRLLQEFLDRHLILSDLISKEALLVATLNQNSAQLIPLEGTAGQLTEKNRLLGEANKKLKIAEEGKLKDVAAEQSQLSGERSLGKSVGDVKAVYALGLSLSGFLKDYDELVEVAKPLTGALECTSALMKIKASMGRANSMLAQKQKEINAALTAEAEAITSALAELKAAQGKLEAVLNTKITALQQQGLAGNLAELQTLLKQKESLTSEITKITGQSQQLKQLRDDRKTYLEKLATVRDEITQRRKAQLSSINQNLAKTIQDFTVFVHYETAGIIDEFKSFLLDAMQGTHFREDAASAFCSGVMPTELANLMWVQDKAAIAAIGNVGVEWADELFKKLWLYGKLHALEVMWKAPCPVITVRTKGANPKSIPVNLLSDGQKHTIMLTIAMLAESNIPLVIDQPEDDLDNSFIFTTVVKVLRDIKERRQVLLVTHNANIAVLGDAELLFPMRRDGDGGEAFDRGSIDKTATKEAVVKILEGGDVAFRRRKEIYGY